MRHAAALLVLLALTIGVYWKLTLSDRYTWLENPDQSNQVRPWLDYQAREIHAGRLPLWDPYEWAGQSLIGQVQPGLANPLNWVLFAMPLGAGHIPVGTLHWYWVLIRWVAAVFCYWLCRDLGAGFWPSILGGAIFAFAGFMGHSGTPQFLMSAVWTPLILLFFARVWRGAKPVSSAALCGAALGVELLGSHHTIPTYTTVLLGLLWAWHLARRWRDREVWAGAAVFGLVLFLVSSLQSFPAVEYGRLALRWASAPGPLRWNDRVPYSVHAEYSLGLRSIPGTVVPGMTIHANPFVGVVAISLAIAAVLRRKRAQSAGLVAAFAIGGLAIALGRDTPLHRLLYQFVPMVEKAREPAMAVVLFQAGVAALAALGASASGGARGIVFVPAMLGAAVLAAYGMAHHAWAIAGIALGFAAVLWFGRGVALAGLALFLGEAALNPPPILRPREVPGSSAALVASQQDIAQFLKRQPGWFRVRLDDQAVPYNFGDWHGIEQFGGYGASLPENVQRVQGGREAPRLFGVRYWVGTQPSDPAQREVFASASGLKIFEDPRVAEPLWIVHREPCAGKDRFAVLRRLPGSVSFEAESACPGLLVAGDPKYPGWRAWVDGRRVVIQEVEGVLRAVPLGAGIHRVDFRYRPASVMWGAGLTILGLLVTAAAVFRDFRRYPPAQ